MPAVHLHDATMRRIDDKGRGDDTMRLFVLLLGFYASGYMAVAAQTVKIGVVSDGNTPALLRQQTLLKEELARLTGTAFTLVYPSSKQYDGGWSADKIESAMDALEKDPGVDIVFAVGALSSQLALEKSGFAKPTFAPFIGRRDLVGLTGEKAKRGIGNFNYITADTTFAEELKTFLRVVPFSKAVLLADETQYARFPGMARRAKEIAGDEGVELTLITAFSYEAPAQSFPDGTEAVMIAPLPQLSPAAEQRLLAALKHRQLPSYSFAENVTVDDGVLASQQDGSEVSKRLRRAALNIYTVIQGAQAQAQPAGFEVQRQLKLNMATARAIDLSPPFAVLRDAVLLHGSEEGQERLTLKDVAEEALRNNLGIIAGQLGTQVHGETVDEVRSVLLPRMTGNLAYTQVNSDNVFVESGFYAEKSTTGALRLEQILFSEKALARLAVQKHLQVAVEAQQRMLELEVVKQAVSAFLKILMAQTNLRIERDNLALTDTNLVLAKGRVDAGVSDLSDVYYWQSRIATAKQRALSAEASVEQARDILNRILHRPITQRLTFEPATLDDPSLLISRNSLVEIIANEKAYRRMAAFFVEEGLRQSPELALLQAQTDAQKRQLVSDRRAYWMPDLLAYGEVSHVFNETRAATAGFSLEDETDWQAGVSLSLPLFEGGARSARSARSRLSLQQLNVNTRESTAALEQRVRSDLHAIRSSYPAIALSKEAAEAARKSLVLIRDNYAEGTRQMTDLLVAQNASLLAEQGASNAVYGFLNDLMTLQRDVGRFDFFMEDSERDRTVERLKNYITADSAGNNSRD
ncbi:TolC family protein [Sulfurimonas sp. HSL3-7]|uniref:TolC family protein n=1 Tax=Sulfonitrofixus jiaomeiensis TaxID=3131938 RepID=UPI0031F968B6